MHDGSPVVLCITPITPPLGGVAMQTQAFLRSPAIAGRFRIEVLRSNPLRDREDPRSSKRLSLWVIAWTLGFLMRAIRYRFHRRPDLVYVTTSGDPSFFRGMAAAVLARSGRRVPIVLHLHARRGSICPNPAGRRWCFRLALRCCSVLGRVLARSAAAIIHLTKEIDDSFVSLGMPAATAIIPNCVEIGEPPAMGAKDPGAILFIGRLSRNKGFLDLLSALSCPRLAGIGWTLDVLGTPPTNQARAAVERSMKGHPASGRIRFHGSTAGDLKKSLLMRCSIVVLPSYTEIFPISLLEGMAAGTAIIATPVGEIPGIPAVGGWVRVEPGDIEGLSTAILELLSDPERTREMGNRNREKAWEHYDIEKQAPRIAGILDRALTIRHAGDRSAPGSR